MFKKNFKIAYFSLPKGTLEDFPRTYLFLDENGKIRVKTASGKEILHVQFARLWARGTIALTKEGENFIKKFK